MNQIEMNDYYFQFVLKKLKKDVILILNENEIEITTIVENCKGCHGYDLNGNEYISSIVKLKKRIGEEVDN